MDVDYEVLENKKSRIKHLTLFGNTIGTVCGLVIPVTDLQPIKFKVKSFWKSKNACKNCVRAAKR